MPIRTKPIPFEEDPIAEFEHWQEQIRTLQRATQMGNEEKRGIETENRRN